MVFDLIAVVYIVRLWSSLQSFLLVTQALHFKPEPLNLFVKAVMFSDTEGCVRRAWSLSSAPISSCAVEVMRSCPLLFIGLPGQVPAPVRIRST